MESLIAAPTGDGRVELRANFDESRNGNQKIVAAEVYVDVPRWRGGAAIQMNAADGSFDGVSETVALTLNAGSTSYRALRIPPHTPVFSVREDRAGHVWLGTWERGLTL